MVAPTYQMHEYWVIRKIDLLYWGFHTISTYHIMHVSEKTWLKNSIACLRIPPIASPSEEYQSMKTYTEMTCNFVYTEPKLWPPVQYKVLLVDP